MGWTGIWQWVVVLAIVLLLFGGRGKISALMGDFGKGLRSFKKLVDLRGIETLVQKKRLRDPSNRVLVCLYHFPGTLKPCLSLSAVHDVAACQDRDGMVGRP